MVERRSYDRIRIDGLELENPVQQDVKKMESSYGKRYPMLQKISVLWIWYGHQSGRNENTMPTMILRHGGPPEIQTEWPLIH